MFRVQGLVAEEVSAWLFQALGRKAFRVGPLANTRCAGLSWAQNCTPQGLPSHMVEPVL